MFGGASELVLQYHSITIHIENAGGSDIDPIVTKNDFDSAFGFHCFSCRRQGFFFLRFVRTIVMW